MSKIVDSLPSHKKSRKEKILARQEKIDLKNEAARARALKNEQISRDKARKGKVAAKKAAAKQRKTITKPDFASDEAGELAVSLNNEGKMSTADISKIKGTGKDGAITVGDIKDFIKT